MATSTPEAPPAEKVTTRDYVGLQEIKINLSDPVAVAEALQKIAGESTSIELLVRVDTVNAGTPRKALDALADKHELDGEYLLIASASINTFKAKTETKRAVSVG